MGTEQSAEIMSTRTRIAIIATDPLYRELLRDALAARLDCEVVGLFQDADFASTERTLRPDVLLCDVSGMDCVEVSREIMRATLTTTTVAIGIPELEGVIVARAEGEAGRVRRSERCLDDFVSIMQYAVRGQRPDSEFVAASLYPRFPFLSASSALPEISSILTSREREILAYIDRGCSNKEIAKSLGIEVATVKNHVHNVLEKMSVHSRGEAVARARNKGWTRTAAHDG